MDTPISEAELEYYTVRSFPSGYAKLELALDLYPWQVKAMDGVYDRGSRVALRTCNESGKTSCVLAGIVLWHMETFPGFYRERPRAPATDREPVESIFP